MAEDHAAPVTGDQNAVFRNVAQNLYRHAATGLYYALLKRGGKQFRRSFKTTDRALANRRLGDLRKQVENLSLSEDSRAAFDEVAHLWLDSVKHTMKWAFHQLEVGAPAAMSESGHFPGRECACQRGARAYLGDAAPWV